MAGTPRVGRARAQGASPVALRPGPWAWLAASAVALLLGGACARHQGWQVNRSRNVALYTEAKLEHEFLQEWLELSHSAMQAFFPDVRTGTVEAVWLQRAPGALTQLYSPLDDPSPGWTFQTLPSSRIGQGGLIVMERRLVQRGLGFAGVRDETVAKQQMAHLFIMKAVPIAPLWLQVGLGRYLQKFRIHYRDDFWLACFGTPVFDEPVQLRPEGNVGGGRRVVLGVDEILAMDWYDYDQRRRHWFEFTAYALVHYLLHGENGAHKARFPLLLRALREGQSTEDALATAYPHVLPDEWDTRVDAHVRPHDGRTLIAQSPFIPQGLCHRIAPAHHAEERPRRPPARPEEIDLLLGDLERVAPFRRHAGWWPEEIVRAEAAKRPGRPRPEGGRPEDHPPDDRQGAGRGAGAGTRPSATPGSPGTAAPTPPLSDEETPTVRVPVPRNPPP